MLRVRMLIIFTVKDYCKYSSQCNDKKKKRPNNTSMDYKIVYLKNPRESPQKPVEAVR